MRSLTLRDKLTLIVLTASASACSSNFLGGPDCPHQVVDKSTTTQVAPDRACSLAGQRAGFTNQIAPGACQSACGDPSVNGCDLPFDYQSAFDSANHPPPDAGGTVCPPAPDGGTTVTLTCVVTHMEGSFHNGCPMDGRRPEGLERPLASMGRPALGAYFAECAHLEAASVIAFEALRDELRAHGAPHALVLRATKAIADEVRHAALTGALAAKFGAPAMEAHAPRRAVRSLYAIALENSVEGVVRETYGAAAALWKAAHASDEGVRRAMRAIATDECEHAELGWDVAAWARAGLTSRERAKLDRAVRDAIAALRVDLRGEPTRELTTVAGVPSAAQAAALLDRLERDVWCDAAA